MDSSIIESVFDDVGDSSDFAPEPKAKAAPKKKVTAAAKPKAAPKKTTAAATKAKAAPKKRAKPTSDTENSDGETTGQSANDASLLSNTPPSAKRQKKAPAPKKSSGAPLQPIDNESFALDGAAEKKPAPKRKSLKGGDQYQKLTQLEHVLKRPDMYIGSVERTEKQMWVYNSSTEAMEFREVSFVPGLYKIFDEILVNAADNKVRDEKMDKIKVHVDREKGEIVVENNGRGIPIEKHSKEGIFVPEMIFGHLLTSSNYDDKEEKITGGRNGYGAKLANIFSTKFIVETADSRKELKYEQMWTENMTVMHEAKITKWKQKDYTKITFYPDFEKFHMNEMDNDFEAMVKRRVYDLAGTCKKVSVWLNDERIKISTFKKYMEMYTRAIRGEKEKDPAAETTEANDDSVILTERVNDAWEVGFAVSDGSFQQVSFVNSIATTAGGTHVNHVADQIVDRLLETVKKRNKGGFALKPAQIRNHIFIFVNCSIVNPAFTSQTKEQLTTKVAQFKTKCDLSEKFLKDIAKTDAVANIIHFAQRKADQALKKTDGNKRTRMDNSKLTDANKAGTRDGYQCTLILTEGDSASLLALAGRAVLDPDRIGVFPLRGKLLNVRDASFDQISKNAELQNIKKFMGLQHKRVYEDTKSLRYGSIMIMTDQDHDGSHIKGLLINFFEVSYPSLLKLPGFLKEFITPIVKVWKGDIKHPKKLQSFFTMPEYEQWKLIPGNDRGWDHKYFKGLGTSDTKDAEIYFKDLDRHLKEFHIMRPHEPELIDLAFSKKKADARKEWLRNFQPGTYLDMTSSHIYYDDFINKELILFSIADNQRSIPSVVDGLKPGQRKVLYTCFRRNLKKDTKVVELAGSVSGLTAYAYGETSMQQTIVGLAQNFVGSNNINCLEPSGNFGSRLQGGKDCASARYIYTRLSPFARRVFHTADEPLLTYNMDDGKTIEPEMYIPIVPMILINGADGIGTGWSSDIPNFNPEDVVENLKLRMNGTSKDDMKPMVPWYRGWKGQIEELGEGKFRSTGTIIESNDNELEITELPVQMWTQDFKDRLEDVIKAEKGTPFLKDYAEYNTPETVHFIVKMDDKQMQAALSKGLIEQFKLSKSMSTTNLVAFDSHGRINKYASVLDILEEFYHVRLAKYDERKRHLLNELEVEIDKLTNQARFIQMIIDGKLVVYKKKKSVLVDELAAKGFKRIPKKVDKRKEGELEPFADVAADAEDDAQSGAAADYDYLLGMAIWSLTLERYERLQRQISDKTTEHKVLANTSPKELWCKDLDDFVGEWQLQLEEERKRAKDIRAIGRRASAKLGIRGKAGTKKRKNESDDSDFGIAPKAKKAAAAKKTETMVDWLTGKPKPSSAVAGPSNLQTTSASAAATVNGSQASKRDPSVEPVKAVAKPKKPVSASTKLAAVSEAKSADVEIDDDDEDIFGAVALEAAQRSQREVSKTSNERGARARKPVKYSQQSSDDSIHEDSDDSGNDLLGDVTNMVKGLPGASNANSKPLFSASSSRPGSSSGLLSMSKGKVQTSAVDGSNDIKIDDETNYQALIPQGSPEKPAARNALAHVLSDDSDIDMFTVPSGAKPALKKVTTTKSTIKAEAPSTTTTTTLDAIAAKPTSPAAKAYAAKLAREKAKQARGVQTNFADRPSTAPRMLAATATMSKTKIVKAATVKGKAKKKVESDDDSDEDIHMVSARGNQKIEEPVAPVVARTKRAAAAKAKSKYMADADSDEDEDRSESESDPMDFDDDD